MAPTAKTRALSKHYQSTTTALLSKKEHYLIIFLFKTTSWFFLYKNWVAQSISASTRWALLKNTPFKPGSARQNSKKQKSQRSGYFLYTLETHRNLLNLISMRFRYLHVVKKGHFCISKGSNTCHRRTRKVLKPMFGQPDKEDKARKLFS